MPWPILVFRTSCCTIIARTHTFCLYSTRCSNSAVRKQPRNKEPSSAAHFSPSCSVQGSYGFDTKIYPPKLVWLTCPWRSPSRSPPFLTIWLVKWEICISEAGLGAVDGCLSVKVGVWTKAVQFGNVVIKQSLQPGSSEEKKRNLRVNKGSVTGVPSSAGLPVPPFFEKGF